MKAYIVNKVIKQIPTRPIMLFYVIVASKKLAHIYDLINGLIIYDNSNCCMP